MNFSNLELRNLNLRMKMLLEKIVWVALGISATIQPTLRRPKTKNFVLHNRKTTKPVLFKLLVFSKLYCKLCSDKKNLQDLQGENIFGKK